MKLWLLLSVRVLIHKGELLGLDILVVDDLLALVRKNRSILWKPLRVVNLCTWLDVILA